MRQCPRCSCLHPTDRESELDMRNVPATTPRTTDGAAVLICDERPAARRELAKQLTSGAARCGITTTGSGPGIIHELAAAPACVVMIAVHDGGVGTAALNLLLDRYPGSRAIVYGGWQDCDPLAAAMARGASGLMIWDIGLRPPHRLAGARGNQHRPVDKTKPGWPDPPLTKREMQILQGMSKGQPNNAIGRELFISEDTVKTHARRLFNKIGAVDRAHAVALGLRTGLL